MENKKIKVIVGMSGGVDSAVSAYLLKEQGYDVTGIFMKNWEEDEGGFCTATRDYQDVAKTASILDIPFFTVNFAKEYQDRVFAAFLRDYKEGLTPNPDILCNREIKFKAFFDKALSLGAQYIATGHYCRTENGKLLKGKDPQKDQSYFLHAVTGKALEKVLFPVGNIEKHEVREIAEKAGIPVFDKKDSTGICFIGERKFQSFLNQFIKENPGEFQTLEGKVVGKHHGAHFYTIGQRRHLGLGGEGKRWFVIKKDMQKNIVYVERDDTHPELFSISLKASDETWIKGTAPRLPFNCYAKIRYRQKDQACTITHRDDDGKLVVKFSEPQRAVAPGQSIVFYNGDECLGGAVIQS